MIVFLVSVLFSEPKIPQFVYHASDLQSPSAFQCSSASRKFLNSIRVERWGIVVAVSVLFSEPKIPQFRRSRAGDTRIHEVSVLFSEPKIPQLLSDKPAGDSSTTRFSALQRAENSSIDTEPSTATKTFRVSVLFSEPKIPQFQSFFSMPLVAWACFSALQRAENSSIWYYGKVLRYCVFWFQCSSASRKFLN